MSDLRTPRGHLMHLRGMMDVLIHEKGNDFWCAVAEEFNVSYAAVAAELDRVPGPELAVREFQALKAKQEQPMEAELVEPQGDSTAAVIAEELISALPDRVLVWWGDGHQYEIPAFGKTDGEAICRVLREAVAEGIRRSREEAWTGTLEAEEAPDDSQWMDGLPQKTPHGKSFGGGLVRPLPRVGKYKGHEAEPQVKADEPGVAACCTLCGGRNDLRRLDTQHDFAFLCLECRILSSEAGAR